MMPARTPVRNPWLDSLTASPAEAVEALMRGAAYLPGLQRGSPCDQLAAVMGDLGRDQPEWGVLDQALCAWLKAQRKADETAIEDAGGAEHFIREASEGLWAVWRLRLPECMAWISETFLDLERWSHAFVLDPTFDLGKAVLAAGARTQADSSLRFQWIRLCGEAARPHLRHRLPFALSGLGQMPGKRQEPIRNILRGFDAWACRLPQDDRAKDLVIQNWRAIKASYPATPTTWRGLWEPYLRREHRLHSYLNWLRSDPILAAAAKGGKTNIPALPRITPMIEEMEDRLRRHGLSEGLWNEMTSLVDRLENFAESTGDAYFLVRTCNSLARDVVKVAPGHALGLVRRALSWAPDHPHCWSLRATALENLGKPDLAMAVLWEGIRRLPMHSSFYTQLGRLLAGRRRLAAAAALLEKGVDAGNRASGSELSMVRWQMGDVEAALALLRPHVNDDQAAATLYMKLLVAEGRGGEAVTAIDTYERRYGRDASSLGLLRDLNNGRSGQESNQQHLAHGRYVLEQVVAPFWDAVDPLIAEIDEIAPLQRVARVVEADALFRIHDDGEALSLVDRALVEDDSDDFAHTVKALSVESHRQRLATFAGERFPGCLPLLLAVTDLDDDSGWQQLGKRFSDSLPLIALARHLRGGNLDRPLIETWIADKPEDDNSWEAALKAGLAQHLRGVSMPESQSLSNLIRDALLQAVDVGEAGLPRVA